LSETNRRSAKRAWPLFVGLPLIVALAVAAVLLSGERSHPTAQGQQPQSAEREEQPAGGGREEAARGDTELGHPTLGDADAPVVMIEYGDFQ
jgi:protein-disulfide isomerase